MTRDKKHFISLEVVCRSRGGRHWELIMSWDNSCTIELYRSKYRGIVVRKFREYRRKLKKIGPERVWTILGVINGFVLRENDK